VAKIGRLEGKSFGRPDWGGGKCSKGELKTEAGKGNMGGGVLKMARQRQELKRRSAEEGGGRSTKLGTKFFQAPEGRGD